MPTNQQWLPSSIQAQMLEQQKKQAMAQALLGSVQTAQPQMVGGRYISPGLGGAITNVAKALMSGKLQQDQLQSQADIMKGMAGKWQYGNPADLAKTGKFDMQKLGDYAKEGDGANVQLATKPEDVPTGAMRPSGQDGFAQAEYRKQDGTTYWKPMRGPSQVTQNNGKTDPRLLADSKVQAANIEKLAIEAQKGQRGLNTLKRASELLKEGNMYTGTGAKFMDFANGLGSTLFGIDRSKVNNDQEYQSLMIRNLEGLVKDIGGTNISNTDLENAFKAGGVDTAQGIAALRKIVAQLQHAAQAKIEAFNQGADAYQGDSSYWRAIVNGTTDGLSLPIEGENGADSAPIPSDKERAAAEHMSITDSLRKLRSMGNP